MYIKIAKSYNSVTLFDSLMENIGLNLSSPLVLSNNKKIV